MADSHLEPYRLLRANTVESVPTEMEAQPARIGLAASVAPRIPRERLSWGADGAGGVVSPTGMVLVRAHDGAAEEVLAASRQVGLALAHRVTLLPSLFVLRSTLTKMDDLLDLCTRLGRLPGTRYAVPDLLEKHVDRLGPSVAAGAPGSTPWHLARIGAPSAWQLTRGRSDVPVCVYDDGIDHTHPAFAGRYLGGYDVIESDDDPTPFAFSTHGTKCAGTIGAAADPIMGVAGVAPAAGLLAVRKGSSANHAAIVQGFDRASTLGACVINCSWGQPGAWMLPQPVQDMLAALETQSRRGLGCVVVWAAGNEGEAIELDQWASSPLVLAVGAVDDRDRHAAYSDTGPALDLCAPSGSTLGNAAGSPKIPTVCNQSQSAGYADFSGTSAAAAIVSGVAALVLARKPAMSARDVKALLTATAEKIDRTGAAYDASGRSTLYGFGLVDAAAAVSGA